MSPGLFPPYEHGRASRTTVLPFDGALRIDLGIYSAEPLVSYCQSALRADGTLRIYLTIDSESVSPMHRDSALLRHNAFEPTAPE